MARTISAELAEIMNLRNTADEHMAFCHHSCNVSLHMIRRTAERLMENLSQEEWSEANDLIKNWPN